MTPRKRVPATEIPARYELLAEHHRNAMSAASQLHTALLAKARAEKDIAELRGRLYRTQDLIDTWYRERDPEDEL